MKIGIVGCGKIAQRHLNAYKKIDEVEITVSDIDKDTAEKLSRRQKIKYVDHPDLLLESERIDAIDVCIPTSHHAEIILKALENGKHVFCEKPLASSLKEAKEIQETVNVTNRVTMVGYLYRFHPAFELVKEALEEEAIGEPYHAMFRVGGRGSHRSWKHRKDEGGGAINEMMVHMLDLIIWYFGRIEKAENLFTDTILKSRMIEGKEVEANAEDIVLLKLETSQGAVVLCESDLITPSYMNYIEIQGPNGSIWTSILDYFPTTIYCREPRGVYNQGNNFFEFQRVDLFERELGYFVDTIKNEERPELNSIEDSIRILEVIKSVKK